MSQDPLISRRGVLSAGAGAAAGLIAQRLTGQAPSPPACADPTVAQTPGPYYPTHDRDDEDPDLTQVQGSHGSGEGRGDLRPGPRAGPAMPAGGRCPGGDLAGQHLGRYDHEKDAANPRPLDPNFQSWAEMLTDADGGFRFKTIKPGAYPADDKGWIRPRTSIFGSPGGATTSSSPRCISPASRSTRRT